MVYVSYVQKKSVTKFKFKNYYKMKRTWKKPDLDF